MQITQALADVYVGGQIEARKPDRIIRGEIERMSVRHQGGNSTLVFVYLKWQAELQDGEWFTFDPAKFHERDAYMFNTCYYHMSGIGGGRTYFSSSRFDETITLHAPYGDKLDQSTVRNL